MAELSIVIFGAGKIGRSFIGQLFGRHGYSLVFVDKDERLVKQLNDRGQYRVVSRGPESEDEVVIEQVSAIHAAQSDQVKKAICEANIMAISIGKASLDSIAPVVAKGLLARETEHPGRVLDIIMAENMRSADIYFGEKLNPLLPPDYPLESRVGLVETSIGKMVPILTASELKEDPLVVISEPYNTLILDKIGFKGPIPDIPEFAPKEHMKAWVDRKTFIHNLGHAAVAYSAHLAYPGEVYMSQVLAHEEILSFAREVMEESARILMASYPGEFTSEYLSEHIENLLERFGNPNLGDTVFRVGCDLQRKLGPDDRFMAIIRKAIEHDKACGLIIKAMAMGFHFKASGEDQQMFPGDLEFHRKTKDNLDQVLVQICGLDKKEDKSIRAQLKSLIKKHN